MRATYNVVNENHCIDLTLRNTMNYPVQIDTNAGENRDMSELSHKYDITKISLEQSLSPVVNRSKGTVFKSDSEEKILAKLKPQYEVFENQFKGDGVDTCGSEQCLEPNELAVLRMCLKRQIPMQKQIEYQ